MFLYKKAELPKTGRRVVVTLAIRSMKSIICPRGMGEKLRVRSARVIKIENIDGSKSFKRAITCDFGGVGSSLSYVVGKRVTANRLDRSSSACGAGINCFLHKRAARDYAG